MTLKTRNKAALHTFGKRIEGVFEVIEFFNCWVVRYETPPRTGRYHNEVFYKPNTVIEKDIQEALAELQWQGRGDHWRGKLF